MFNSWYEIFSFTMGIFAALTTVGCFIPQGIKTLLSKDTAGLSKWFLILAIVSSIFWLIMASMTIAAPFFLNLQASLSTALTGGLPSLITNIITLFINVYILVIKTKNMSNAKKLKISESEYCHQIKKDKGVNL